MLDMLEKEINSLNLLEGNIPEIVTAIANSIPSQTIPYRMKIALAISEIMLFTSQFRINIKHWNDSIIPINSIMFCIAKSGASKDSSLKAARKCFEQGYNLINEQRNLNAVNTAIQKATEAGYDVPHNFASYKDFYLPPNPLFLAISTTEGFIQHLNDLSNDTLGAGYIFSGEVGAELSTNLNLTENIKVLAELYDEGSKEVKILKSRENQSREVKNLPVSALFIGSQDNLLYDDSVKRKFKTEFTTKLARRSFLIFVNEDIETDQFSSINEMMKQERLIEDTAIKYRKEVSDYIKELTSELINHSNKVITINEDVRDLFSLYRKYNEEIAKTIDNSFPMAKLTRTHLQWKALKLAGALALIQQSNIIELEHYRASIEFVELINNDIKLFERELVKEPYELFTEYVRLYASNGTYSVNLHTLRKSGYIPLKGQSDTHLKELVKLANSYDEYGIYTLHKDTIVFKELEKTNTILLSYLECSGTKEHRSRNCSTGYQCEEVTFKDLKQMLEGDYAYTPFRFINGVRGKDNIDSSCKWIVMDVDSSEITDKEVHLLLSDINHYVIRSSNKANPHKFRVLIELDTEVDVPQEQWIKFIQLIAIDLGLVCDKLSKAQIFFSYKDRDILSQLEGETLKTKKYLNQLTVLEEKKPPTKKEASSMLEDPLTTFDRAYNAKDGEGRRKLIWACRYARELGATREYCKSLLDKITSYWVKPLPEEDLTVMKRQLDSWSFD
jgi:hypothetical protein